MIGRENPLLESLGEQYLAGPRSFDEDAAVKGVFSAIQIRQAMARGHILIHPFVESSLQQTSYDVTLGPHIFRTDRSDASFYDWTSDDGIEDYFTHEVARPHHEIKARHKIAGNETFSDDELAIYLAPGERILAHTNEFIGIRSPGTTQMQARSTIGRNGIAVCFDAGWGDPGYLNRWTMEVMNINSKPIVLGVGRRIAQIVFYAAGPSGDYQDATGNYQQDVDIRIMIANWTFRSMLPKSHLDRPVYGSDKIAEMYEL